MPWLVLSLFVFLWGIPQIKAFLDGLSAVRFPVPGLDRLVFRVPPVVAVRDGRAGRLHVQLAVVHGDGDLRGGRRVGGPAHGLFVRGALVRAYGRTLKRVRFSLLTVAAMLSLGYVTRYSGLDATLGWPSPGPASSIPSSGRCSAGSASP